MAESKPIIGESPESAKQKSDPKSVTFTSAVQENSIKTYSLEPSRIDVEETVGMKLSSRHHHRDFVRAGSDITNFSLGFHPCVCCNVSLRAGVRILAFIEIVHWGILLVFCLGSLLYWLLSEDVELFIGDVPFRRNNSHDFITLLYTIIVYAVFCAAFLGFGIVLLLGVLGANRKFVLVWLIGTFSVEILRMIAAIILPLSAARFGLLYWCLRAYEYWTIIAYTNKLKEHLRMDSETDIDYKKKRRKRRWRWGKRKKTRASSVPALVPITYYGIFRDDESENSDDIIGYQLQVSESGDTTNQNIVSNSTGKSK